METTQRKRISPEELKNILEKHEKYLFRMRLENGRI